MLSPESYWNLISQVKDYAIFTTDPRGVITTWNEGCKNVLGYDRDEFIGQHIKILFPPEAVASGAADKEMEIAAEEGAASDDRWMMRKGDERFWSMGITTGVRDEAGDLIGFTKVVRDLTERKMFEERLRRSEAYLRVLTESLPQLVWTCGPDGKCDYLSPQWVRYTGVAESEQLSFGWLDRLHPDDRGPVATAWDRAVKEGDDFDVEYRIRGADGDYRWFKTRAAPLRSAEWEVLKWFGTSTDIEDQKRIEGLLRESEERYRLLVENAVDYAIVSTDLQGLVTGWNAGAERILGYSEAEMIGRPSYTMLLPEDVERGHPELEMRQAVAEGRSCDERWLARKDGSRFYGSGVWMPLRNVSGELRGYVKIFRDLTDRKRVEEEREQIHAREREARAAAEEANRLKDEFLATVSHELRSPLNAILGWARLLRDPNVREEQLDRALEIVERNAQAQTRLIEDLLDVSRIVSGKLDVHMRPVTLNQIIDGVVADMRPGAEAKGVGLRLTRSADEIGIIGDADRLEQVARNLLSNAIKFTPEGGRIEAELRRLNTHVELRVSDTGRGISPEFLPHVFDRFRQAYRADAGARAGLGLGLAIVRHVVEAHGGIVTAESAGVGRGATFTVRLPIAPASPEAVPAVERRELQLEVGALPSLSGVRVLVVDDDEDARDLLTSVLGNYGAEVKTAAGAAEALDLLATEDMDVLVSDINMPGMDGYELIRRVRAMKPEQGGRIPAVALTAYARAEDRVRALQAGYQTHVPKPVEPAELEVVVATLARSFKLGD
jgi:PAS domain S-box-containing protein